MVLATTVMLVRAITLGDGEHRRFAGVDIGSQRHFACVIDLERKQLQLPQVPLRKPECVAWLTAQAPAVVAIGGPPAPNNGVVTRRHGEPATRRLAERRLGIGGCYTTPANKDEMVGARDWMAAGLELFRVLGDAWGASADLGGGDGRLVETQPSLAFRALLGHEGDPEDALTLDPDGLLPSKHTRAGRRARIVLLRRALTELGIDPTRWIEPWARRVDWADATMAAVVACWRAGLDEQLVQIGDGSEGVITLRLADWRESLLRLPAGEPGAYEMAGPWRVHRESTPPPSRRAKAAHPGWLLRFEGQKAPEFGAEQFVSVLAGEISVQGETWLPLRVKGQALSGLTKAVEAGRCELATSLDGRVRAIVEVLEVRGHGESEIGWHALTGHADNPWQLGSERLQSAACWIRVTKLREVELGPEQFETGRKDGGWGQGYPQSAAPLVRWRQSAA